MNRRWVALAALVLAFPAGAQGRPGDLDETFSRDGIVRTGLGTLNWLAVQPDRKVLVIGGTADDGDATVARFEQDGDVDAIFGSGGVVRIANSSDFRNQVVALADGRILVGVLTSSGIAITRLMPNGQPDPSFGNGGTAIVSEPTPRLAPAPDGGMLLAGGRYISNDQSEIDLVRLRQDGSLDPSFSGDGRQQVTISGTDRATELGDVIVADDGSAFVGWGVTNFDQSGVRAHVLKLTPAGESDSSYGDAGVASSSLGQYGTHDLTDMYLEPAGSIVFAGGACTGLGQHGRCNPVIGRFTASGEPDPALAGDGALEGFPTLPATVVPRTGGGMLVAGTESGGSVTGGDLAMRIVDSTGKLDQGFGEDGRVTTDLDFAHDRMSAAAADNGDIVAFTFTGAVLRYDMDPGPPDADADGHLDDDDRCRKRFARHRTGCPPFERSLKLGRRDEVYVLGRIAFEDDMPKDCAREQPVWLMKRRHGPDRRIDGTVTYGKRARWFFDRPRGRRQGLYVLAPQRIEPELGRCMRERVPAHAR